MLHINTNILKAASPKNHLRKKERNPDYIFFTKSFICTYYPRLEFVLTLPTGGYHISVSKRKLH